MLRTDDLKYDDPVLLIQEKSNDNNISFVRQFIIDIYYFWEDEFSRSSLYVFLYKYINFLDDQWYKFISKTSLNYIKFTLTPINLNNLIDKINNIFCSEEKHTPIYYNKLFFDILKDVVNYFFQESYEFEGYEQIINLESQTVSACSYVYLLKEHLILDLENSKCAIQNNLKEILFVVKNNNDLITELLKRKSSFRINQYNIYNLLFDFEKFVSEQLFEDNVQRDCRYDRSLHSLEKKVYLKYITLVLCTNNYENIDLKNIVYDTFGFVNEQTYNQLRIFSNNYIKYHLELTSLYSEIEFNFKASGIIILKDEMKLFIEGQAFYSIKQNENRITLADFVFKDDSKKSLQKFKRPKLLLCATCLFLNNPSLSLELDFVIFTENAYQKTIKFNSGETREMIDEFIILLQNRLQN